MDPGLSPRLLNGLIGEGFNLLAFEHGQLLLSGHYLEGGLVEGQEIREEVFDVELPFHFDRQQLE